MIAQRGAMQKVHLAVLYTGLALAVAMLVFLLLAYDEQEMRIAALEGREQNIPADVRVNKANIDALYDLSGGQQARIAVLEESVSANQTDINSLYDWSDGIVDYLNSGQQSGTSDTQILVDVLRAYSGDPAAIARLPQHLATLSGG